LSTYEKPQFNLRSSGEVILHYFEHFVPLRSVNWSYLKLTNNVINPAARLARKLFEYMRRDAASIRIQKHARGHSARKAYRQVYESAIVIQTGIQAMAARNEHRFRRETKASIIIQVRSAMVIMICS